MSNEHALRRARKASRDARLIRPALAFGILMFAAGYFLGFVPADTALIAILIPALVGLAGPRARGAPTYAELVEMLEASEAKHVDPLIDVLTRRS